ncbi:MAG: ABC transporter ATP-binding protein [Candidatus Cloacimonetes bacterium]|nr:ABC transporter ATP-binding protein [Candidatus Cloacimonadota bacterium]
MNAIEISQLSKYYGKFKALDQVNLTIPSGRIIGLFGKNGAGKSTLMKCLLGFLKHDGEIKVMGKPLSEHKHHLFNELAFIPDVSIIDDRLTVQQTIDYVSNINPAWNSLRAQRLQEISKLPMNKKVGKLSKGMKTKLYLMITLSLDVSILLLDEPTIGLDIAFRREFFSTILGEFYDDSKTILISTHQVEEVEHILNDIIFIDEGKIILHDGIEELKNRYSIISVPTEQKDEFMKLNPRLITPKLGSISGLVEKSAVIEGAEYRRPSLTDLFLAEVGGYYEN